MIACLILVEETLLYSLFSSAGDCVFCAPFSAHLTICVVRASGTTKANPSVLFFVFLKNILQPALVLGGLRWLGYGNPIVSEAVLTTAHPAMPIVIMLSLQYRVAQTEAASAVFLSVICSVITLGVFIALTRQTTRLPIETKDPSL